MDCRGGSRICVYWVFVLYKGGGGGGGVGNSTFNREVDLPHRYLETHIFGRKCIFRVVKGVFVNLQLVRLLTK